MGSGLGVLAVATAMLGRAFGLRDIRFLIAELALAGLDREYPNKPADVLDSPKDIRSTRATHPAFFGSFDWHSSVHAHWLLVRLLRTTPRGVQKAKPSPAALKDPIL